MLPAKGSPMGNKSHYYFFYYKEVGSAGHGSRYFKLVDTWLSLNAYQMNRKGN